MASHTAVILGLEGHQLSDAERGFFREVNPAGYILFARNCADGVQLRALTDALRELSGDAALPILIDQEGGRVARLRAPHWRSTVPAAQLAALGGQKAARAMAVSMRLIAEELHRMGITVNCAPIADVPVAGCHDVIGDRALGDTPQQVAALARIQSDALLAGGVLPVLKHIPGHGRGMADSHLELPTVTASLEELRATDFVPFKLLNDLPFGMTAHIRYTAIDAELPATLSPKAIALIREELGFDGCLMSDDASMKALSGSLESIACEALAAGCDVVLHCNGKMEEMVQIVRGAQALDAAGARRLARAKAMLQPPQVVDVAALEEEFRSVVSC